MLKIHKKIVIDENQNPVAVQIPIEICTVRRDNRKLWIIKING